LVPNYLHQDHHPVIASVKLQEARVEDHISLCIPLFRMPNKSPYKTMRDIKRMAKFNESKSYLEQKSKESFLSLSLRKYPGIDIPPVAKILVFSKPVLVSIPPTPRPLSVSKPVITSISPVLPQPPVQSTLAFPKQKPFPFNQPSNTLTLNLNKQEYKHHARPASILDTRIPQLDGSTYDYCDRPQPAPDILLCISCQKVFETLDNMRWHNENKYGREDCKILRSMLPSNQLFVI
jgi:hypothetical protein